MMKHGVLVHKFETWYSAFDPDYQDETSEMKAYADMRRSQKQGQAKQPKPADGLDYIDKENLGHVYAGGFIRTMCCEDGKGGKQLFEKLDKEEKKTRIKAAWRKHSRRFPDQKKTHHRLVFSMSNEMHDKLKAKGLNPDAVLQSIMKRSMRNYNDKYHPGDSVGYTYGIHHDTDNLHVHVFVHPRTKKGQQVSFSQQLKSKRAVNNGQEDKLGFLKESVATQVRFWEKKIEDPKEKESLKRHFHSEKFFYAPKPKLPQDITIVPGTPRYQEQLKLKKDLEAQREKVLKVDAEIKELKASWSDQKLKKGLKRLSGRRESQLEKAFSAMAKQVSFSMIREKQQERQKLHKQYLNKLAEIKQSRTTAVRQGLNIRNQYEQKTSQSIGFKGRRNPGTGL